MGDRDEERQAFQIPADEKKPVGPGSTPESSFDPTRLEAGNQQFFLGTDMRNQNSDSHSIRPSPLRLPALLPASAGSD